jgi:hypothetical protein
MTSALTKTALVIAATASLNAFAGTTPAPQPPAAPLMEPGALFDTVGAELSVGYDTRYYFRGLYFADNTLYTGLNLSVPVSEKLTLGFGALYTEAVQSDQGATSTDPNGNHNYSELDLFTSLTYDAGFAKFALGFTHYEFFDGFSGTTDGGYFGFANSEANVSSAQEVGLTISKAFGIVNTYIGGYYDFRIGGMYLEAGVDATIAITPWMSLVPSLKTGYGFDYYSFPDQVVGGRSSGFTHVIGALSAPIRLTKSATLAPYVAWNHALTTRNYLNATSNNEVFGGVRLGVTF